jgi:hypothetical protein
MSVRINPRDRRALIGLALAIVVYVALAELALPAWDRLRDAPRIAGEREAELERYKMALLRRDRYEELELFARERRREFDGLSIRAESTSLASVQLQSIVESAATGLGVTLDQRSMIAPRSLDDFFGETAMAVTFECTPNQLASLLAAFEGSETLLTVRRLDVQPVEFDGRNQTKKLRVSLTVGALIEGA